MLVKLMQSYKVSHFVKPTYLKLIITDERCSKANKHSMAAKTHGSDKDVQQGLLL